MGFYTHRGRNLVKTIGAGTIKEVKTIITQARSINKELWTINNI